MSGFEDFYTSHKGIKHEWENAGDGTYNIRASQDLEGVLDFCKAAYNHNDGYSKSRELKRAFFLPRHSLPEVASGRGLGCLRPRESGSSQAQDE